MCVWGWVRGGWKQVISGPNFAESANVLQVVHLQKFADSAKFGPTTYFLPTSSGEGCGEVGHSIPLWTPFKWNEPSA